MTFFSILVALIIEQLKPLRADNQVYGGIKGFAMRIGMVAYWKKFGWPDLCKPAPEKGPDAFVCR